MHTHVVLFSKDSLCRVRARSRNAVGPLLWGSVSGEPWTGVSDVAVTWVVRSLTLDIMKNLCAVFGLLGTQFLLLHGRRCCSSHREYHLRCPRGSRAEGNPSETHALRPPLPQSWGWTRWTAAGAFPHAAFQTQPPRLRIQLQADTAAKASTRAAAEHLLKRSRMHTLANRRLKQDIHWW